MAIEIARKGWFHWQVRQPSEVTLSIHGGFPEAIKHDGWEMRFYTKRGALRFLNRTEVMREKEKVVREPEVAPPLNIPQHNLPVRYPPRLHRRR